MSSRSAQPRIPRQRSKSSPPPPADPDRQPTADPGRHRVTGRRPASVLVRTLILFLVALCTGAVLVPTSQVSAAVIPDAITDVVFAQGTVTQTQTLRLDLTFHIGAGIDHPGGTAQEGDTFALQLDPRLEAQTSGFAIYTPDNTAKVADVTIDADGLATFTLTDYVESRTATDGSAFWATNFREQNNPLGDTTLLFTSGTATWEGNVTIVDSDPGSGGIVPPFKGASWANGNQTSGRWNIYLPAGPMDRIVLEDDRGSTGGPGWEFDCTAPMTRDLAGGTEVDFQCTADYLRWEIVDVPPVSDPERQPQFGIAFNVTDPSPAGDLIVENRATYTATYQNQITEDDLYVYLQRTRGGVGQGGTVPVSPSVTPAECDGTQPTAPDVTPALNGGGVTYSIEGTVAAGETVHVIGTLSPGYTWDSPITDGWQVRQDGTASYEIVLTSPNCSITTEPVDPTVTPAACAGPGDVTPPTVIPADDTAGITYSKSGDEIPGGTVTVTATLADNYQWGTLSDDWTISTDNRSATWSVTLADIDCTITTTPVDPDVTPAACAGPGDVTPPTVSPADDTAGITYSKSGDEIPGGTVTVTATLTDNYQWGTLSDDWTVSTDNRSATWSVTLADIDCTITTTPVDPDVTPAACAGPGDVTPPTVIPADNGNGITYDISGDVVPGGTFTIRAVLADGYTWGTLSDDWAISADNRSATYDVTFDAIDCTVTATPVDPDAAPAACAGPGDVTPPTVSPADDTIDITYTKAGDEIPGGTVTVTATLTDGYTWGTLSDDWIISADNRSATYDVTFDAITCDVTTTTTTTPTTTTPTTTTPTTIAPSSVPSSSDTPTSTTPASDTSSSDISSSDTAASTTPTPTDTPTTDTPTSSNTPLPVPPAPAPVASDDLAYTGASGVGSMVGFALAALFLGALLVWAGRRRSVTGGTRAH